MGRTSAYMLYRILAAHDGQLPTDVHVCTANTGKEREESLTFGAACARHWGVPIHVLEYRRESMAHAARTTEVQWSTASRHGEPFDNLLRLCGTVGVDQGAFLPGAGLRICSQEMKTRVLKRWAMLVAGFKHWDMVIGIRADEPIRVAKNRRPLKERYTKSMPLVDAGITEADIMAFWATQSFDLQLNQEQGNCDLCFDKRPDKLVRLMRAEPRRGLWWAAHELRTGKQWRPHAPSYSNLLTRAVHGKPAPELSAVPDGIDCACTD